MMNKFSVASVAFAMFLGLAACSDDSSGTSVNDDIDISSSAEKQDLVTVDEQSSSALKTSSSSSIKEKSSSSVKTNAKSSSSEEKSVSDKTTSSSSSKAKEKSSSSAKEEVSEDSFYGENWREDCLAKINEYRATEDMPPLTLADEEKHACADKQSADDLAENSAHGHFKACGEFAQNSGPNFSTSWLKTATAVSDYYLTMMWEDEKALVTSGERDPNNNDDYPYIGHYLNMKNKSYTKVACGIALDADGKKGWLNINFY